MHLLGTNAQNLLFQLLNLLERPVSLAVIDDALRQDRADPGDGVQVLGGGPVKVNGQPQDQKLGSRQARHLIAAILSNFHPAAAGDELILIRTSPRSPCPPPDLPQGGGGGEGVHPGAGHLARHFHKGRVQGHSRRSAVDEHHMGTPGQPEQEAESQDENDALLGPAEIG